MWPCCTHDPYCFASGGYKDQEEDGPLSGNQMIQAGEEQQGLDLRQQVGPLLRLCCALHEGCYLAWLETSLIGVGRAGRETAVKETLV
eukprot:1152402-Pelagomonas_calceolata.AAC.3